MFYEHSKYPSKIALGCLNSETLSSPICATSSASSDYFANPGPRRRSSLEASAKLNHERNKLSPCAPMNPRNAGRVCCWIWSGRYYLPKAPGSCPTWPDLHTLTLYLEFAMRDYLLRPKSIPSKAPILYSYFGGLLHVSGYRLFFLFLYLGLLAIILSSAFLTDGFGCRSWSTWTIMD